MKFTYKSYLDLLKLLKKRGYKFSSYHNYYEHNKCVIMRHDIDYSISEAVKFSELECETGVSSTYFVLVTSDFYNCYSKTSQNLLKKIIANGHEIGLHFDEVSYADTSFNNRTEQIIKEAEVLSEAIDRQVSVVSMHRPSKEMLLANLEIPGIINTYSSIFFKDFKYLSDSRRNWREPVKEIISSNQFNRLQILTHAFWYKEFEENIQITIKQFINRACFDRYINLKNNFTDLESIMKPEEVYNSKE